MTVSINVTFLEIFRHIFSILCSNFSLFQNVHLSFAEAVKEGGSASAGLRCGGGAARGAGGRRSTGAFGDVRGASTTPSGSEGSIEGLRRWWREPVGLKITGATEVDVGPSQNLLVQQVALRRSPASPAAPAVLLALLLPAATAALSRSLDSLLVCCA